MSDSHTDRYGRLTSESGREAICPGCGHDGHFGECSECGCLDDRIFGPRSTGRTLTEHETVALVVAAWRHAKYSSSAEDAMLAGIQRLAEMCGDEPLPSVYAAIREFTGVVVGPETSAHNQHPRTP